MWWQSVNASGTTPWMGDQTTTVPKISERNITEVTYTWCGRYGG